MLEALRELVAAWRSDATVEPFELGSAFTLALVRVAWLDSAARAFGDGWTGRAHEGRRATTWADLLARFAEARARVGENALFDARVDAVLASGAIDDAALERVLALVTGPAGTAFEKLLGWELGREENRLVIRAGEGRRKLGAHYTSPALAAVVVERALAPILETCGSADDVLDLAVCDPAMGAGVFLLAAAARLAARVVALDPGANDLEARQRVLRSCIFGVDKNPLAVAIARLELWLAARDPELSPGAFDASLAAGDAIVPPFDWRRSFARAFDPPRRGFDAIVGNPPWVSYAGRAAQPMPDEIRSAHLSNPAFGGYRNLQSLFVQRGAELLRPGGRLGLVLPTSMSDLAGYEPSRRAHDRLAIADVELPDFGDSFEGVFQPCMALLSTRREGDAVVERAGSWPLARSDLDGVTRAMLERLDRLPRFPPETFGERGFQTNRGDVALLLDATEPKGAHTIALRTGTEIAPFERKPPTLFANPDDFGGRIRDRETWRAVKLLIRQTARYPMVVLSDGVAFRNSVLAGFDGEAWSAAFLVAYLNAGPVRFYHFMRHRDARQGMPQLKIGHLRALPAPREQTSATRRIEAMGRALGERNTGVSSDEREELDAIVSEVLELTGEERERVSGWVRVTKG